MLNLGKKVFGSLCTLKSFVVVVVAGIILVLLLLIIITLVGNSWFGLMCTIYYIYHNVPKSFLENVLKTFLFASCKMIRKTS